MPRIDRDAADRLPGIAEQRSYQQLCLYSVDAPAKVVLDAAQSPINGDGGCEASDEEHHDDNSDKDEHHVDQ